MKNLNKIAECYKNNKGNGFEWYLAFYKMQNSLPEAIEKAALARYWNIKRQSENHHPHQRRISLKILRKVNTSLLKKQRQIKSCKNFEKLIEIVKSARVNKFGKLATYDTALRIGSYCNIQPNKVYLHCGAQKGADILLPNNGKREYLGMKEFPKELRFLGAMHIENLLCICKGCIKKDHIIKKRFKKCCNSKSY